jgi:DNA uptake protein ComE-like DNA-binding protein
MKRSESKRPSESFILGVIALVFLIIGYQTAMFVYKASLTRIAANRDHPDTVFVYQKTPAESGPLMRDRKVQSGRTAGEGKRYVRKNAEHSPHVEAIRENLPRNKVESFSFNPNTATLEDFCRLGFTPKQAQSILNYRAKGGRYRRKEDFSKSFVVSDSLYRRLEPYIDIPLLDLNLADSAAFDALPGIGGYFASKIVEYRRRLGGYSYKEQLMDIWKFDQQKYSALEDLITVNPETTTPYPLWTLPADSLRLHPYISNYETARAIVMFRENTPRENLTVDALIEAGILPPDSALKLSRCLIETSR